jgi:hypothetical protein
MKTIQSQHIHRSILAASTCLLTYVGCANAINPPIENIEVNGLDTTTTNTPSKGHFTIKDRNELPTWVSDDYTYYMLNDNRILEDEEKEQIIGVGSERGYVFFLDGKEKIFKGSQVNIRSFNGLNTQTMNSDDYQIQITWDDDMTTGAYKEGNITLYLNKIEAFHGPLIIMGWY